MANDLTSIKFLNFDGGLNAGVSDFLMLNSECIAIKNCWMPKIGKLEKVPGYSVCTTNVSSISPSNSPSTSPSKSLSPSVSVSISPSISVSVSPPNSYSPSVSLSVSPSLSPSISVSKSPSTSVSVSPSISTWDYEENFNSLNDGELAGQDSWLSSNTPEGYVGNYTPYEGAKCLKIVTDAVYSDYYKENLGSSKYKQVLRG